MKDAKKFVKRWSGRGYEKGETHSFWLSFLRDVLDISEPEKFISFEVPVKLKHTSFIDAFLPDTKVIIEQKSLSENLSAEKSQSDGLILTPYEQAQRYGSSLPYSMRPRWIVVCNFAEFLIYDMETLAAPTKILLSELPEKFSAFDFLIDSTKNKLRLELELSLKAGEIVAKIYDALLTQYINPNSPESLASLNKLCVRLVFCLYAESSGIFGKHKIFRDYLAEEKNIRWALIHLFEVLNTPLEARDPYLDDTLKKFPYVNGGLFAEAIEIPNFTPEIKNLLLEEASSTFNWSGISPTIFGAVFESTLNPETRRAGGMHYTSIENIHKVIDPLFLDDLHDEFSQLKTRKKLLEFQDKLAAIKIFDPACGSGNFLTESYISLRRIENQILKTLFGSQIQLGELDNPIKISIGQFYGIEINDFAVAVAQTALWIAELQMMIETQEIIHRDLDFLPLKSYANIHKANALRVDWSEIVRLKDGEMERLKDGKMERLKDGKIESKDNSTSHLATSQSSHLATFPSNHLYIIGNPPFVGRSFRLSDQKNDLQQVFAGIKGSGNLDYVACWYKKAADFIDNNTSCAFVSTNSVSQGIAVPPLWKYLFGKGIVINFAHQTFKWTSESDDIAAVHCVVVGFAKFNAPIKKIFSANGSREVDFINAYLTDGANVIVEPQKKPIQNDIPLMFVGSCPVDDGNFLFTAEECAEFIKKEPAAEKWILPYVGSKEFIQGKKRFCLYLKNCAPNELRKMPRVMERVKKVREFRLASKKLQTRRRADTPTLFTEDRFIDAPALLMPMISGTRQYVPIGFVNRGTVVNNNALFIPNADLYHFGVLTSKIHMAWLRTVGGRFGTSYQYGVQTVYNTFAWAEPTLAQKRAIEASAQKILDVRARYFKMESLKDGKIKRWQDEKMVSEDELSTSFKMESLKDEKMESEDELSTFPSDNLSISFAELYDELTMPADLRAAHKKNDLAVAKAYGFEKFLDNEPAIVAALMKIYESLTKK